MKFKILYTQMLELHTTHMYIHNQKLKLPTVVQYMYCPLQIEIQHKPQFAQSQNIVVKLFVLWFQTKCVGCIVTVYSVRVEKVVRLTRTYMRDEHMDDVSLHT